MEAPPARQRSLRVRFEARERADRLVLVATDAAGGERRAGPVDSDELSLTDIRSGAWRVELRTRSGRVMAAADVTVPEEDPADLVLRWPRRGSTWLGTLRGSVALDPLVAEAGLLERATLELAPLHDSEAQDRAALDPRRRSLRAMEILAGDLRAFEFGDLPAGSYLVRIVPLGFVREVRLEENEPAPFLELDPGNLARALISFCDPDGAVVWPAHVSVRSAADEHRPLRIVLRARPEWNAYDWVGVPGRQLVFVRDPRFGERSFECELEEGWNELRLDLDPVWRAELRLAGAELDLDLAALTITPLDGGRVISSRFAYAAAAPIPSTLDLQVSALGRYLCRYGSQAGSTEHLLEVDGTRASATWNLAAREDG